MPETSNYSFVKLEEKEYHPESKVVNALQNDLPASVQFLNIIQIVVQKYYSPINIKEIEFWSYKKVTDEDHQTKVYGSNWDDPTRPLFLVCFIKTLYNSSNPFKNRIKMLTLIYCRDDPTPHMMTEFSNFFDWSSNQLKFGAVNARFVPFLTALCQSKGGSVQNHSDWVMYLPKDKWCEGLKRSKNVSGMKVEKLREDHAQIVNNSWKFGNTDPNGSVLEIKDGIKHFISAGVYLTNAESNDDELASWIISLPIGTLNALHTSEKHRQKGYAEMVLLEASAQAVQYGIFPLCEIELESTSSKALFEKLGFKLAFDACWVFWNK